MPGRDLLAQAQGPNTHSGPATRKGTAMLQLQAPALLKPALELRRYLDGGGLLTPWAEKRSGQPVHADVERTGPMTLDRQEAGQLGLPEPGLAGNGNWAALRRSGELVQADGTKVARVTSVVALARITPETVKALQTTRIPLGTAIGDRGRSLVLWCSVGICEYAVACGRLILVDDMPVALTTDWVLWSWLGSLP